MAQNQVCELNVLCFNITLTNIGLGYQKANSMEQNPAWEADCRAAAYEIPPHFV
jgi:hypothetical protein